MQHPSETSQFAQIDAYQGSTMLVFGDVAIAYRYAIHRKRQGYSGALALVEDTRTRSGLCVMWRDPVSFADVEQRQANCRWMLEEVLAGRYPRPVAGAVAELWTGGFPGVDTPGAPTQGR
jgi:hypothetical protein